MYISKNKLRASVITALIITTILKCDESITITAPTDSGTVIGNPLSINGTSSQPNLYVRIFINDIEASVITTDTNGNWSQNIHGVSNGTHTLTVHLTDSLYNILATNSTSFTVNNGHSIKFISPISSNSISCYALTLSGTSTFPSATVNLSLDGSLIATTTADADGNWQTTTTLSTENGSHTILAELVNAGNTVASSNINVTTALPIVFPSGASQIRIIDGNIPTSGSGSGQGYTYTVSGSAMTINFVPAFSSAPSITATGLRSSGSSTVSLSAVSATAVTIAFSTGTQKIHFSAAALQ